MASLTASGTGSEAAEARPPAPAAVEAPTSPDAPVRIEVAMPRELDRLLSRRGPIERAGLSRRLARRIAAGVAARLRPE